MSEKNLAQHFQQYFTVKSADTPDLKKAVYKLRYDVYCTELEYEKDCPPGCEKDKFDDYSSHVLIQHKSSGIYAGSVRLVTPPLNNPQAPLPFEVNCLQSVDAKKIAFLEKEGRIYLGELSRLAVLGFFRRRSGEKSNPYGINLLHNPMGISAEEMRYFPFIAVALYMASASIAITRGIKYIVVMMEPRLAKHLSRFGICFIQLGEVMDYHGERAMFYIDNPTLFDNFKPELEEFYQLVDSQLKPLSPYQI
ncbi:MAG: PEP-CTERM/exosortase system-associated acyltransferase [Methylobacter sp.]|nr:PEP-CTERM/exosortase system-associated acyltransferase [Methylobacter sp.]